MKGSNWVWLGFLVILTFSACDQVVSNSKSQRKVLFLGNSITQNGTYVSFIDYYLRKYKPDTIYEIISIGLSSETVSCLTEPVHPFPRPCLQERLGRALTKIKPDVVFACYGMNDGIYHPQSEERFLAYQTGINNLVDQVNRVGAKLILLTPPPFDSLPIRDKTAGSNAELFGYSNPYVGYDQVLRDYAEWLLTLEQGVDRVIDVHDYMKEALQLRRRSQPTFTFAQDGIHPSEEGHFLMALCVVEGLGIEIENKMVNRFEKVRQDSFYQLVSARREAVSETWLPYVGYVRGDSVFVEDLGDLSTKIDSIEHQISKL